MKLWHVRTSHLFLLKLATAVLCVKCYWLLQAFTITYETIRNQKKSVKWTSQEFWFSVSKWILSFFLLFLCLTLFYRPQGKSSTAKKQLSQKAKKSRKQESSAEEDDDDDDDDDDDEEDTPKRQTRRRGATKVKRWIAEPKVKDIFLKVI